MARTWPTVSELQKMLYGAGIISALPAKGIQSSNYIDYQGAIDAAREDFEKDTTIKPFLADGSEAQVQYLQFSGSPGGGTVKLSYDSVVMAGTFAYNGTAATLQTALEALSSIGSGNVDVTGDAGGPYTVTLDSSLFPYSWILLNTNSLTGGTSPSLTIDNEEDFQSGPWDYILQLENLYVSIRSVKTSRSLNNAGVERTYNTEFEYEYMRNSKAIEQLRWYGFQGGQNHDIGIIGRRGYSDDLPANVRKAILAKAALSADLMPLFSAKKSGGAGEWREGDVSEKAGASGYYGAQMEAWSSLYDETVCKYKRLRVYGA